MLDCFFKKGKGQFFPDDMFVVFAKVWREQLDTIGFLAIDLVIGFHKPLLLICL